MANKVQITPLVTGYFWLPRAPFFGVAEPVIRNRFENEFTVDENDRIFLYVRGLLVRTPDGIFVIEPGLGTKKNDYAERYNTPMRLSWKELLKPHKLRPEDVTGVFSSHLHWDHAGGNTSIKFIDNTPSPTFPNATYFLHESELQHAKDKASHRLPQSYDSRDLPPENQIETMSALMSEAVPHIWIELTGGHTPGHCMIHIEADDRHHVFIGDIAPTHVHLTPRGGYEMAFDDRADIILRRKQSLLKRAKEKNWRLWFVHDPFYAFVDWKGSE